MLLSLVVLLMFQSCVTKRNLVYLSDLPDSTIYQENINNNKILKIQEGDILSINVTTLNPESNILYNNGSVPTTNSAINVNTLSTNQNANSINDIGYVVDDNGSINFPVIGKVLLKGLTIEEAQQKLFQLISKTDKGVIVNIHIQNFNITVVGEVARPGMFKITKSKINILEALGMAGDMTPYAERNNVLLIREVNGKRTALRLNLNDKAILESPYYYLQQNDVVYVEPENKLKANQVDTRYIRLIPIITATISALAIVLSKVL